jgi:hypothetical protein
MLFAAHVSLVVAIFVVIVGVAGYLIDRSEE